MNRAGSIGQSTLSAPAEFRSGAIDVWPLAVGVAIYGLAFGLLAAQAQMDGLQVGLMGTLVFAGSSQIVAVERTLAGAEAIAAVIAGVALNLRLALITASVRELFQGRPAWQIALGAHFATDENWALLMAGRTSGRKIGYWYLIGSGVVIMATWVVSTVTGAIAAQQLPEPRAIGMDFAFAAAFIAIGRALWRSVDRDLIPWIVTGVSVLALALTNVIDTTWSIIIGGVAGAVSAAL
ncbi:MAG: AzlC family ABC transporter permease, partial [Pseudomonadota bacterium]